MELETILSVVTTYALPVLAALFVLYVGLKLSEKIAILIEASLNKAPASDPSVSRFLASLFRYFLMAVTAIAALTIIGIDTSSMAGMILGLSAAAAFVLQYPLGNLAAGVMLNLFRPFKVGDEIEVNGVKGIVQEITLSTTQLKTRDNVEIILGNGNVWGGVIRNHSSLGQRRLDMDFGVSYEADINAAIETILSVAKSDPRIHAEPAPWAKVVKLNDSSVDIQLRAWCDYEDLRGLKVSISQPIKVALDSAGIGIPYPHIVKIRKDLSNPTPTTS